MGQALRREDVTVRSSRRAHPRLVTTPPARAPRSAERARVRAEEARARHAFSLFVVVLVSVVALGGVRVALIAQAAQASLSEGTIQAGIKTQRAAVDQLEVDRSALSTPSRIAGIASTTMQMGEPKSVRYISLSGVTSAPGAGSGAEVTVASAAGPLARVLGAVTDLSAGEAQSLLVGDLGLAGSR
jgi:cell division protein FtsL